MKRRITVWRTFLAIGVLCCSAYGGETLLVEAENAQLENGQVFSVGGVECAVLSKKDSKLSAEFQIPRDLKAAVWLRVFYTWGGSDALHVSVDGGDPLEVTARNDRSGRWDNGNFQVWHWARAGEVEFTEGSHTVSVTPSRGAGQKIDKIVLYEGPSAWREPWLTADLSRLAANKPRFLLKTNEPLVMEAEEFDLLEAAMRREDGGPLCARIVQDAARVAVLFQSDTATQLDIYVRQFFEAKNMFEGYTMEEMAENCYVELDGELVWTFFEQDGRRWHWRRAGCRPLELQPGVHLLAITKQGSPVRVDKVAIVPKGAEAAAASLLRPAPHVLPLALRNDISYEKAKRVSDWALFGELAEKTKGEFLGEERDGISLPARFELPRGKGSLILEKLKPIRSCEAAAPRNREQRIVVPVAGDSKLRLYVIYEDREGERFLSDLACRDAGNGWMTAAHIVPIDYLGARGTYFDATGGLTKGPLARPVYPGASPARKRTRYRTGPGNHVPDYPLAITHLFLEKPTTGRETIVIGEPYFDRPFDVRAEVRTVKDSDDGTAEATIRLSVMNKGAVAATVPVSFRTEPLHYDFRHEAAARRVLSRRMLDVDARQSASLDVTVSLASAEPRRFLYVVGQSDVKTLFIGGTAAAPAITTELARLEKRHGAFRVGPLKTKNGKPTGFTILIDGLDVTSREYADKMDYAHPLAVRGYDLSDSAGWPSVHVPYGIVAVDPELGRIKFAEGDEEPLSVVGRSDIGFAVPGHGAPVIRGDYAYVPPGEGNHTVVDISDKRNPKPISFLPSWYFSRGICPFRERAYVESSRRGLMMVDGFIGNPYRPGPLRSIDFDREKHGRFAYIFEDEAVAVSAGGGALWFHDLSDPYLPREIAKVENAGGFGLTKSGQLAFVTVGDQVRAIDVSDPHTPRLIEGSLERPKAMVGRGKRKKEATASVASIGNGWLALRLGTKFIVSRWKVKRKKLVGARTVVFEPGFELPIPKGCGKRVFCAFHKGHFYILDGKGGPGQYGIRWGGPKSRWFVYDLASGPAEPIYTFEEPTPTAYGHITVEGDYAYINDYNYGMWIFDLSDPAKPVKLSGAPTGGEGDACWANGPFVYVWQTFGGHLFSIDVRNPEQPVRRGCYWDGAWVPYDNRFRGNYTVAGTGDYVFLPKGNRGVLVIDQTDPARPKAVGEFLGKDGKPVLVGGSCIHAVDDRAYLVRRQRRGPSQVLVYDVSTPATPKLITTADVPVATTLFRKADILYLAGDKKFCLVSVKNDKPEVLATLDLASHTKEGQMIGGIAVTRGHAYLTSRDRAPITRLYIVDVREPKKPRFVGLIDPLPDYMDAPCSSSWGDFYQDLVSDGQYLFIGDYAQIECYDASIPERPRFVGRKPLGYQWSCGKKWGEHLFVPGLATMTVLDVPTSSQVPAGKVEVR